MRNWSFQRPQRVIFPEGAAVLSLLRPGPEGLQREDVADKGEPIPEGVAGWWRWRATRRPPTQRELNERLEQLFLSLKNSTAESRGALGWLAGLYLTRKRIVRQEGQAFVHVKSGERVETKPEELTPEQLTAAIGELMEVIA